MASIPNELGPGEGFVSFGRPPETDRELWELVRTVWGVSIPWKRCCPGHRSPFEAFADAFFARSEVSVWKASRGLGGKSFLLSLLAVTEMVALRSSVTILGGSGTQSENVHKYMIDHWAKPRAPRELLASDPAQVKSKLVWGNTCTALMASQTSVRGPHPQRLRLDEVDEMKLAIFDAALGQPMSKDGVASHTVCSSTHQYPDGTMTEVLRRAAEKGWPIYEWCYRENQVSWLSEAEILRTRARVSAAMWNVEYKLGEPSPEGRAIEEAGVKAMFDPERGTFEGRPGEVLIFEEPIPGVVYCTGADWARDVDWTVIETRRADTWELVAWERQGRKPYPAMIGAFNARIAQYPGTAVHDLTGLGKVVDDYIEIPAGSTVEGFWFAGRPRAEAFTDYVAAIEAGHFRGPRVEYAFREHLYVTNGDLYGRGTKDHPPDSVVAGAMCWKARELAVSYCDVLPVVKGAFTPRAAVEQKQVRLVEMLGTDPRGIDLGRVAVEALGASCAHARAVTVEVALDVTEKVCPDCGARNKFGPWFHP